MTALLKTEQPQQAERQPARHPHCIICNTPMRLARIEPSADEEYEWRTFECPNCSNAVAAKIKSK
jgi:hypothetical protein